MSEPTIDPVHGHDFNFRGHEWAWREPGRGEHFRRCSWCGSIHPDDLVAEPIWRADWADWKYGWPHKFYVEIGNRDPGALFVLAAGNTRDLPTGAVLAEDLTDEQQQILTRDGFSSWAGGWVQFGTRAHHFAKFYTVHLADPAISNDTIEAVERGCGLRFEFFAGRVMWQAHS